MLTEKNRNKHLCRR